MLQYASTLVLQLSTSAVLMYTIGVMMYGVGTQQATDNWYFVTRHMALT